MPNLIKKKMQEEGLWISSTPEMKAFVEAMDSHTENFVSLDALAKKMTDFATENGKGLTAEQHLEFKELIDANKVISMELKKLQEKGLNTDNLSPVEQLLGEHKAAIEEFRTKKSGRSIDLFTKTAIPTDIATHTIGMRVPGIGQLPVRQPFMFDLFPVVSTTMEFVKYIDQESVTRDAKNCADITPITTTTALAWKERSIQITKVKDFIYISLDMMADYDFVAGELTNLVNSSVMLKADNSLLKGTGTNPDWHSVDEIASEFDASNTLSGTITSFEGTIVNPSLMDLCIVMAAQIVSLGKDNAFNPNVVLWNSIDKYKSMLIKDPTTGQYITPPFVMLVNNKPMQIDSMQVRTNPNVDANTCYVMDSTKGTIYMRKGIGMEMAYEDGTNFQTETVTMKAYMRGNLLIRNVHQNAFMKCSDVTAALAALKLATV